MPKTLIDLDNLPENDKTVETLALSFARAASQQRDLIANTIKSSSYMTAFEALAKQIEDFKKTISIPKFELPKLEIPEFTLQAIRDTQSILDSSPTEDTLVVQYELLTNLEFARPANQNDVSMIEKKIDIVSGQLMDLSRGLATNTNITIYCRSCNELMAKVKFMLLGQMKCSRCRKLRNIPGDDIRVVIPTATI